MASRSRAKSENSAEPVAGSLHAEILRALRRLIRYEGSIAAVARSLGMKRQRLSRWLSRGIPKRDLENTAAVEQLLAVLYARFAQLDVNQPTRDARERKLLLAAKQEQALVVYEQPVQRRRIVEQIRGWCRRHEQVAKLRGVGKSGIKIFAEELGVRADLIRAALRDGTRMSVKLFTAFQDFEARYRQQEAEDERTREKMVELMEKATVPAVHVVTVERSRKVRVGGKWVVRKVMVQETREDAVLPKVPGGSWDFSGEGTSGRRWGKPMGKFLLPRLHPSGNDGWGVIESFVRFALGVPGLSPAGRYPEWNVYAMASEYGENFEGSKQQYRELGDEQDNRSFVVSEAYSGGNHRPPRARERTIAKFIEHIGKALDGHNVVFAHGGIAWNFRRRSEDEKERIEKAQRESRDMEKTLAVIKQRVVDERKRKQAGRERRKRTASAVLARRNQRKK